MSTLPRTVEGRHARRIPGVIFEIVETVVLTAVIFLLIQAFVAQPFEVRQQSMAPRLEPGQNVLVDKLTPRWDPYKRLDIVVFTPPSAWTDATDSPFIKRVIGIGGDEVEIRDGLVFVNGSELAEPYLDKPNGDSGVSAADGPRRWLVPAGDVFVMGDNRTNSIDSRVFGAIPSENILGRAWLRYWPLENAGVLRPAF
jgi:signal peptidase I